ncbi:hypothetical protein KGP93_39420, partial [Burkholderia multivorans]|nr:hypothetical protein [Burkholderia multivorans]
TLVQRVLIIWTGFDKFKKRYRGFFCAASGAREGRKAQKNPFETRRWKFVAKPTASVLGDSPIIVPRLDSKTAASSALFRVR